MATKGIRKLTDLVGHETLNVPFTGIQELTDKTIIILDSKSYQVIDKDNLEKTGVRITFRFPDSQEIRQTSSKSYIFVGLHELLQEQEAYPIEVTIRTKNKQYVIE